MKPFKESNSLLNDPPGLRKRLRDDGYLFLRSILPKEEVVNLSHQILEICEEAGWLRPGSNFIDGQIERAPITERDDEYVPVYAQIQALETFHRLKLNKKIISIMETIFQEPVIPFPATIGRISFPRNNERATPPHQDWIFVRGSIDTLSCWVPLGDIPSDVGGLKILEGSHKAGFLEPRPSPGPGGRTVYVDPSLEWAHSNYCSGDILIFKMLTIHSAAANLTPDLLRLSADFRYTGESHVIDEEWLLPHFYDLGKPFTWEILEKEWCDSPTAHYWDRFPNLKTTKQKIFWE